MKKIVAFIVSAAFVLPTFALTVNVGDDIAVAGKTGSVTKIIDVDKTRFEMDVLVDGTTYTFGVTKDSIVPLGNKDYKVTAVQRNRLEMAVVATRNAQPSVSASSNNSTADAK